MLYQIIEQSHCDLANKPASTMSGCDHRVTRTRNDYCPMPVAHLPSCSVCSAHADYFSFARSYIDERTLDKGVVFVLPLQVGRVNMQVGTPQILLKFYTLILKLRIVFCYFLIHDLANNNMLRYAVLKKEFVAGMLSEI